MMSPQATRLGAMRRCMLTPKSITRTALNTCSIAKRNSSSNARSVDSWTQQEVVDYDREHVFHPYTSMTHPLDAYVVKGAKGVHLELEDGRSVVDGMSSWWACIHGYQHPVIDQAIKDQVGRMSHVMFGGITHRPAVELVKRLVDTSPKGLEKVFLCDSGSVAVEVALKMAVQYFYRIGKPSKSRMLTLRSGYHGDTFGAMSVCDPVNGMHSMFSSMLAKQLFADAPTCKFSDVGNSSGVDGNGSINDDECPCVASAEAILSEHHNEIAGLILEPIVQGAGGMRFYSPRVLRRLRQLCDKYDVLLIADEIATGFGRTGKMFACEHADVTPDIMCVGKAMTGGYMTMGATLTTERVAHGVSQDGGVFMHGPTFMGNPLACAAANASLEVLDSSDWQARVGQVESQLNSEMASLRNMPGVADVRVLGAIGVCELEKPVPDMAALQALLVDKGVWLRPFGKLLYTMPTFNCPTLEPAHIATIVDGMHAAVEFMADSDTKKC